MLDNDAEVLYQEYSDIDSSELFFGVRLSSPNVKWTPKKQL